MFRKKINKAQQELGNIKTSFNVISTHQLGGAKSIYTLTVIVTASTVHETKIAGYISLV